MKNIVLIGNPNCGKTTIFNALTGTQQQVGNWPGVTVEKKTGQFSCNSEQFIITDLPGIYSLTNFTTAQDEQIATEAIRSLPIDIIINVIDACHLERHLYLTSQILELEKPTIVILTMLDLAKQRDIQIDIPKLAQQLSCPIIPLQAHKKIGIEEFKNNLVKSIKPSKALLLNLQPNLVEYITALKTYLKNRGISEEFSTYYAYRFIEDDLGIHQQFSQEKNFHLPPKQDDWDIEIADKRYQKIHNIIQTVQKQKQEINQYFTAKLDRLILHRIFALPIFLLIMYLMFLFSINIGGAFQDFFDLGTEAIFVNGSQWLLQQLHAPNWLIALLAQGVGKGINTTLTFIPVIFSLFFFLSFLEISGYMARAAFIIDKIMRFLGLPGKAFIPMIVGFGCNVPAIMAARTLESFRDRIMTIMMVPFMSCSARLAIYAVFVTTFFPHGGHNIIFSLYFIGIIIAVLTGLLLRKTLLSGAPTPLILELPAYHRPSFARLMQESFRRLRHFIVRAGSLIIPICIILGLLNNITITNTNNQQELLLALIAKKITPIFAPMGLTTDNWPATVGLFTGMLAKEVVIGSLNSLYAQINQFADITYQLNDFNLFLALKEAFLSIPQNIYNLSQIFSSPLNGNENDIAKSFTMKTYFDGAIGAYAYLLFILLYVPCASTIAVIRQELNNTWMWFAIIWSFILAYTVSVLFYQLATYFRHPGQSTILCLAMIMILALFILLLPRFKLDAPNKSRHVGRRIT